MTQSEQVFLSYSRTDLEAAIALRSAFEHAGISTFRDEESIRAGDNWMNRLQTTLQGCSAFVLLIGRDGVQRWVMAEAQIALIRHLSPRDDSQRLPIFPIVLPDGDLYSLPPFLNLFQIQRWQPDQDLPDELIQAVQQKLQLFEGIENAWDPAESPYLGLSAFQPKHKHLFFGRRKETLEALKYLGTQQDIAPEHIQGGEHFCRWLQVEGNSGAGKSSLVNAGMLPLIEQGALWSRTNYSHWKILGPMMPGEKPLHRLAELLEHELISDEQAASRDTANRYARLKADPQALTSRLRDFKTDDTAYLLVVDQFEELFTFSDPEESRLFDQQLATALKDNDCPLFLISTVRIDFLEGFETLPCLSELYNNHCKRYLLKTIGREGLREVIEQPARLANLDVTEVTAAILQDAQHEVGALPLVENALHVLWEQRQGNRLSSQLYMQKGGIAGLLEEQADALLARLEKAHSGGRADALELLLALTRINDEGRHTRRRLPLAEARLAAGGKKADPKRGQQVIDCLSGRLIPEGGNRTKTGSLRLITTVGDDKTEQSIDLIHETLIRARGKDPDTGKLVGYWKTLYDYIGKHRDRGFYRDQLSRQATDWQASQGLNRWWKLASWRDLKHYRTLPLEKGTTDERYRRSSQRGLWWQTSALALVLGYIGQAYLWTLNNGMPPASMLTLQQFRLMNLGLMEEPLPEMVLIKAPEQAFKVGELDKEFGEMATASAKQQGFHNMQNFGYPPADAELVNDFTMGKYEVTYTQYDYYIWQQQTAENGLKYPAGAVTTQQRGQRPVTQVSWNEANGYLQWLSDQTGQTYRLPTEVEWEYAARGGSKTAYFNGDEIGQNKANCKGCGSQWENQTLAPVGSFTANAYGLHDVAGNVWEWTCSEWSAEFDGREAACNTSEETDGSRVIRGGSWNLTSVWLRSSARNRYNSASRSDFVGFRVIGLPMTH